MPNSGSSAITPKCRQTASTNAESLQYQWRSLGSSNTQPNTVRAIAGKSSSSNGTALTHSALRMILQNSTICPPLPME